MKLRWIMLSCLALFTACGSSGTFALLDISAGDPSLATGVAAIDLHLTLGTRSMDYTLHEPGGGDVSFPTSVGIQITGGAGTFTVQGTARGHAGQSLATGTGTGTLTPGQTVTIALQLGGTGVDGGTDAGGGVIVTPGAVTVTVGRAQSFTASLPSAWSVAEAGGGTIDAAGLYTAPLMPGSYHVIATANGNPALTGSATVTVAGPSIEVVAGVIGGQGNTDGIGPAARFSGVSQPALVSQLNAVYLIDNGNLRKIDLTTNAVTTLITAAQAGWTTPWGLAALYNGDLYISDYDQFVIYKVAAASTTASVFAGLANTSGLVDGIGGAARFNHPSDLAIDSNLYLYCADTYNSAIRKIDLGPLRTLGQVTTLAGGTFGYVEGTGAGADFKFPGGVSPDNQGNLFVYDSFNDVIRQIVIGTGVTSLLAGSPGNSAYQDGTGMAARFEGGNHLIADGSGNVWVAGGVDYRKVEIATGIVTTPIGTHGADQNITDGVGAAARFYGAGGGSADTTGALYVSDYSAVRKLDTVSLAVTTLAGSGRNYGYADGTGPAAQFANLSSIAADGAGNVYITEGNETVRKIVLATGAVTTVAGQHGMYGYADGPAATALFRFASGITAVGDKLYIADSGNNIIREVNLTTNMVSTVAGQVSQTFMAEHDGIGQAAVFSQPNDLVSDGTSLFVADSSGCTIRQIDIATTQVTTLAGLSGSCTATDGTGSTAHFEYPGNIGIDGLGNLFTADYQNSTVRRIVINGGAVKTIAGVAGTLGFMDGPSATALFQRPSGVTGDATGKVYVADTYNSAIRLLTPGAGDTYTVSTVAGSAGADGLKLGGLPGIISEPVRLTVTAAGDLAFLSQQDQAILLVRLGPP